MNELVCLSVHNYIILTKGIQVKYCARLANQSLIAFLNELFIKLLALFYINSYKNSFYRQSRAMKESTQMLFLVIYILNKMILIFFIPVFHLHNILRIKKMTASHFYTIQSFYR